MRHLKKKLKFSRSAKEAKRLLRNLLANLILYERIETTEAKAKKAKGLLDRLINIGKKGDLAAYRQLLKFFYIKEPAKKIVEDLAKRYTNINSGYSRIIRLGRRKGDGAMMVIWELVEVSAQKTKRKDAKNQRATKNRSTKQPKSQTKKSSKQNKHKETKKRNKK